LVSSAPTLKAYLNTTEKDQSTFVDKCHSEHNTFMPTYSERSNNTEGSNWGSWNKINQQKELNTHHFLAQAHQRMAYQFPK